MRIFYQTAFICLASVAFSFGASAQNSSPQSPYQHNSVAADQLDLAATKELSPDEVQKFLKSTEAGAWRIYAIQGPACSAAQGAKPKNTPAKEWAQTKKECVRLNTECRKAQNLAKKYSVQSICSDVYYEIDVLLTTASAEQ